MLLNIIDFIKDTGYTIKIEPAGKESALITLEDPGTGIQTKTELSEDAIRRVTNRRAFESRIIGVMCDQLRMVSDSQREEIMRRRRDAEKRRGMMVFWNDYRNSQDD